MADAMHTFCFGFAITLSVVEWQRFGEICVKGGLQIVGDLPSFIMRVAKENLNNTELHNEESLENVT